MTSYTALSRLSEGADHNNFNYPMSKADDEILFSDEKKNKLEAQVHDRIDISILEFIAYPDIPKGAAAGNLIHSALERFSFFALAQEIYSEGMIGKIKNLCERYSLPETCLDQTKELLQTVVTMPIRELENNNLSQLVYQNILKEMPFYLSVSKFNTLGINKILLNEKTFQSLEYKEIEGLLTGFIDLIFIYNGKYYLADYKSNSLNDYSSIGMIEVMKEHNYGLQLWIYALVLQRFLEQSLPDYSYDKYFGGTFCFFVRGMNHLDSASGVFFEQLEEKKLQQLDKIFTGKELV
jgi:exodeoxyribonuclease V beta subunit